MQRILLLALLACSLCFCGCFLSVSHNVRMHRDKSNIRQNILITRQSQQAFRSVWGAPTRTFSQGGSAEGFTTHGTGDDKTGNLALHPKRIYDLWYYAEKQVTLVFYNRQLAAWAYGAEPQFLGPKAPPK